MAGTKGINLGDKNGMWKEDVGYIGLHYWVRRHWPEPDKCQMCYEETKLDLCNISGLYKRTTTDWIYLCRRCHMYNDGRMKSFKLNHKNPNRDTKTGRYI